MNTINPLLSIIIPSYNQGEFIERTLKSIFQQDCSMCEVIVIDGGSTDNTLEILKKYEAQIDHLVSEKDKGQSHAFNKGLALAKGKWIGWQNSDDCYTVTSFSEFLKIHENNGNHYDVIFSDFEIIDKNDHVIHVRKFTEFSVLEYVVLGGTINNCSAFFKKDILLKVNGLDENLQYYMDHDLYLKLAQSEAKYKHFNKIWGQFRVHPLSKGTDKTGRYFGNDPRKKYYPWYKKNSIFIKVLFIFFKLRRVVLLIFRNEWKLIFNALKRSLFK